jgi:hypothetical protein
VHEGCAVELCIGAETVPAYCHLFYSHECAGAMGMCNNRLR